MEHADPSDSAPSSVPPATDTGPQVLPATRTSGVWVAVITFIVVLLLIVIFLLENSQRVEVSYFGTTGHLPLAAAMLLSAVAGGVLVAAAGVARILQLRHTARRERRARRAGSPGN
ncbi:MAG: lipopolysaccharide assembly protein [Frankiales bacterium]|nr:lipopolysaccharide assembly protein [Frankiales bacterium]